jgi:hypothetical protein
MEREWFAGAGQIGFAELEEALLKNYAQDFFAEELLGLFFVEIGGERVSGFPFFEIGLSWDFGEFEEIEGTVYGVDGEEAGLVFAAEVVFDAVEVERYVDFGDALEGAGAEAAVEGAEADSGEFSQSFGLGDDGF